MKFDFDLQKLGFSPSLNSYFKELNFSRWEKINEPQLDSIASQFLNTVCSNSQFLSAFIDSNLNALKYDKELLKFVEKLDAPNFWMNEKQSSIVHILAVLARREKVDPEISMKIVNFMSKSEIVNISLLFDPVKLFSSMRTDFAIQNKINLNKVSLFLSSQIDELNMFSQKVRGLICVGAEIKDDVFVNSDNGCCHLPSMLIYADINEKMEDSNFKEVAVFFDGQTLFNINIKIDKENEPELVYLHIPSINSMFEYC